MLENATLRIATEADAAQIAAIYAPIVRDTIISFEIEPPHESEMRSRIERVLEQRPWLVCVADGQILGYVYAISHRDRAAYRWSADVSAYIHADHRRKGIGATLYAALFEILRLQGYANAFAGITLPNPASVGLHESLGFRQVGVYRGVGNKFGAWHNTVWLQLALQELPDSPPEPIPFPQIASSLSVQQALRLQR